MKFLLFLCVVIFVALAPTIPVFAQQGGGFSHAGVLGEYFDNPNLQGQSRFARHDVRINFGWGTLLPVGGSRAEPYKSFPHDNFSVRWTGEVIPRFSEPYTFVAGADEGVRVKLGGKTIIDNWDKSGSAKSAPIVLNSGQKIAIIVEYRQRSGPAYCVLKWQSPSTPIEIVDVVTNNALNAATWPQILSADAVKTGRPHWEGNIPEDESGGPQQDGEYIVWEGSGGVERTGTYGVQFHGKAQVWVDFGYAAFEVDGKTVDKLEPGMGYDAATNTTRALMKITRSDAEILRFHIKNSQRSADSPINSGISGLKIMRPLEAGSPRPHNTDEVIYRPFKKAIENYSAIRWLQVANVHSTGKWQDRTKPDYISFTKSDNNSSGGEKWEILVMLANETGKDLYICTPVNADDEYFIQLARLLRYGSDGDKPYSAPTANPVYPPLNSNLRVYFEVGNEIWNWGFASTQDARSAAEAEIKADTPEAKIFNYNGQGNYRTWHALRTVRASNIFRSVFGDAAMDERIRPLLEYQYNNYQDTAWQSFKFLDAYFNNGDGNHVPTPHPVNYYIWGAGGATYYGVGNDDGHQSATVFSDLSFEETTLPDGTELKAPPGGKWKFVGNAGLYRLNSVALTAEAPAPKETRIGANTLVGMKFKTGARTLWVKTLGRWAKQGQRGGHFYLVRSKDNALVADATLDEVRGNWMQKLPPGYYYAPVNVPGKEAGKDVSIRLEPNTEYALLVGSTQRDDLTMAEGEMSASGSGPDISIQNAIQADTGGNLASPESWKWTQGAARHTFGPVNFQFRTTEEGEGANLPDYPAVVDGSQAAWLRGTGEISQSVNFASPGKYALIFHAASTMKNWPGYLPFDIYCDDQKASPMRQGDHRVADNTSGIGGFARAMSDLHEEYGSAVFTITSVGSHVIRLVGKGNDDQSIVFDEFSIASLDAILNSGFGAGSAFGQIASNDYQNQLNNQASYARAFGLPVVAYEAGWSLGGDFNSKPIQGYAKFSDARARAINNTAMDIFTRSGGFMNVWGVYQYWPESDTSHASEYPLMQSLQYLNDRLPAEARNGAPIPASLKPSTAIRWSWSDKWNGEMSERGQWGAWLVVAPKHAVYALTVESTAGGNFEIEADGKKIGTANDSVASKPFLVTLGPGTHGIRVRSLGGKWSLKSVSIAPQK
ncbi:anti-sigma-I factor RsgI3 [Abditibacteriota bacterium]|nr:anti-sigma-I factor RsgI3 [Abditibacteriota bacterium]